MAEPRADGTWLPTSTVAKLMNLTPRRCQQLAREGHVPSSVKGKMPVLESLTGYIRYLQQRESQGSKKLEEDARYKAAQAQLRELELARVRGEVVSQESEGYIVEEVIGIVCQAIDALPARMAVDCSGRPPKEVKQLLEHECARTRQDLYAGLKKLAARARQLVASRESAEAKKRGRVGRRKPRPAEG